MDALCSQCCELQLVATGHLRVVSRLSQLLYWQGLYWRPERDWAVDAGQEEMKQSPRASPGWTVKNIILGPTQARWDSTRVWSPYVKVYGPRRESRMTQKVKTLCLLLPVTCIQNIRHSLSSHPHQPISDASSGPCSSVGLCVGVTVSQELNKSHPKRSRDSMATPRDYTAC